MDSPLYSSTDRPVTTGPGNRSRAPKLVRTLILAEPPVVTLFVSTDPGPLELLKLLATRPRIGAAMIKFAYKGLGPAVKAFREDDVDKGIRRFGAAVLG